VGTRSNELASHAGFTPFSKETVFINMIENTGICNLTGPFLKQVPIF
jgi:hypothetical protein